MPAADRGRGLGARSHSLQSLAHSDDRPVSRGAEDFILGAHQGTRAASTGLLLAKWLWSFLGEPVQRGASEAIHREPGGAPSYADVSGGVSIVPRETRHRV